MPNNLQTGVSYWSPLSNPRWAVAVMLLSTLAACHIKKTDPDGTGGGAGGSSTGGAGGSSTGGAGGSETGGAGGANAGGAGGSGMGEGGFAGGCVVSTPVDPGVVAVETGLLQGQLEETSWVFRGIPYARQPERFKAPKTAACWDGIRAAAKYTIHCPHLDPNNGDLPTGEENCLSANVWTPDPAAPNGKMPVIVYLHGGNNMQGSAADKISGGGYIYNGGPLSTTGKVVIVTINYRLGPFGFLALPELDKESGYNGSGNYGLMDQIAALQWVQRNISAFGGDPTQVTLMGQSGGGADTLALVASPLAKGLFHDVIVQSPTTITTSAADAKAAMSARVDKSSCGSAPDRLACLRGKTTFEILMELPGKLGIGEVTPAEDPAQYGPIVDNHVLLDTAFNTIKAGKHNHVPMIIGSNSDEVARVIKSSVGSAMEFQTAVNQAFGSAAAQVLAAYPVAAYGTPQEAWAAVFTDMRITCPVRTMARAVANAQTEPVYRYFFTRRAPKLGAPIPAAHGIELFYIFHSLTNIPLYTPAPEDLTLADEFMGYWSKFGTTKDPNGGAAIAWPQYDAVKDSHVVMDNPVSAADGVRTAQCDAWASIVLP